MALRPGVRGQVRVVVDDKNGDHIPDISVSVTGAVPFFREFTMESIPRNAPVGDVVKSLTLAASAVPGPAGAMLGSIASVLAESVKQGNGCTLVLSVGDQDRDGRTDVRAELDGHVFAVFAMLPVHVDTGVVNIPVQEALTLAGAAAGALPTPANQIAMAVICAVRFLVTLVPV